MKNRRKVISVILAAVLSLGVFTGCGNSGSSETNTEGSTETATESSSEADTESSTETSSDNGVTVRIAYNGGVSSARDVGFNAAFLTGHLEEILAEDGVKFEISSFANGPAINEAFLAGEIDIANSMGDQPLVVGINNGVDVTTLGSIYADGFSQGLVVAPDSEVTSVEELKGKKVSVYVGTNGHKQLLALLSAHGLSGSDVELVNIAENDAAVAALAAGDVDAIFIGAPVFGTVEEKGIGRPIGDLSEHPTYIFIQSTQSFADEHPEIVKDYLRAIQWGEEWFKENEDEYYKLTAEYFGISEEDARSYVETVEWGLELTDAEVGTLYETSTFLVDQGLIPKEVPKETIDAHVSNLLNELD